MQTIQETADKAYKIRDDSELKVKEFQVNKGISAFLTEGAL